MNRKIEIFDSLEVARDRYIDVFKAAQKKYDEEVVTIKKSYIPKSDLFKQKMNAAKKEFDGTVQKEKDELNDFMEKEFATQENAIKLKMMSKPDPDLYHLMQIYDTVPLTRAELDLLAQRYCNKDNYMNDKMIAYLANKHNLKVKTEPDIETQLDILDDLRDRYKAFIDGYGTFDLQQHGSKEAMARSAVSDEFLGRLKAAMTNNYIAQEVTDLDVAKEFARKIRQANDSTMVCLAYYRSLKLCENDTQRDYLLYNLTKHTNVIDRLDMPARENLEKFKNTKRYHQIKKAHETMEEIKLSDKSIDDVVDIVRKKGVNDYTMDMLHDEYGTTYDAEINAMQKAQEELRAETN